MGVSGRFRFALCSIFGTAILPVIAHSADSNPGFNCANPRSSVESAVCGDGELGDVYWLNQRTYERLKANPAAFDIMLTLSRERAACIKWKPNEPYKACMLDKERAAILAYEKLESEAEHKPE